MGHKAVARTEPSAPAAVREKDDSGRRMWNTEEAIKRDIPIRNCDRLFHSLDLWWCHTKPRHPGLCDMHLSFLLRQRPLQKRVSKSEWKERGMVSPVSRDLRSVRQGI